ncbi:MAG: hypothetical protein FJ304_05445 [Planctomycetes bacterium]|nr:hypothetical protein [Planctomycetota bacterium]
MPVPRKRVTKEGQPAPCAVTIVPDLAVFLYEERLEGHWKDEGEIVNSIVREWARGKRTAWAEVRAKLAADETAGAGATPAAGPKGKGTGKKPG